MYRLKNDSGIKITMVISVSIILHAEHFLHFNLVFCLEHRYYSVSLVHPESYVIEKLCLIDSLARLLLFLAYDNNFDQKILLEFVFS